MLLEKIPRCLLCLTLLFLTGFNFPISQSIIHGIVKEPSCVVPKIANGSIVIIGKSGGNVTFKLPESVLSGTEITFFCDPGFVPLTKTRSFICQDELVWSNADEIFCKRIPIVVETSTAASIPVLNNCSIPLIDNFTAAITFFNAKHDSLPSNEIGSSVFDGTKLRLSCKNDTYELITKETNESICNNGTWSVNLAETFCQFKDGDNNITEAEYNIIMETVTLPLNFTEDFNETAEIMAIMARAIAEHDDAAANIARSNLTTPVSFGYESTMLESTGDTEEDNNGQISFSHRRIAEIAPVKSDASLLTDADLFFSLIATDNYDKVAVMLHRHQNFIEALDNATETPLIAAARVGAASIVELFINKGADIEAKDITGQTALMLAAKAGVAPVVELLLNVNARIEDRDSELGRTPLIWAAALGHIEVVKLLVENHADIMTRSDSEGKMDADGLAIHFAAANGHVDIVDYFLTRNRTALIEARNEKFETVLMVAASHGKVNVVGRLIKKFAAPLETRTPYNKTALMKAIGNDQLAVVQVLIRNGANTSTKCIGMRSILHLAVEGHLTRIATFLAHTDRRLLDEPNAEGNAPLYLAAQNGQVEIVKYFVEEGANIAKTGQLGRTAIHAAAAGGHEQVVRVLATDKHRSRIWAQSKAEDNGDMAIHLAIRNHNLNVVKTLISLDEMQIEAQNLHSYTPLQLAILMGENDIACYVAGLNSDKEIRDSTGQTPLIVAAGLDLQEIVHCLVQAGANATAKSSLQDNGNTPLHVAASKGSLGVIKYLVNNVSQDLLELRDASGATPLISAVLAGQFDAVKMLVELGAKLEATTFLGIKTALWLAASTGDLPITEYLVSKGAKTEAVGEYGRTPLLAAAAAGHLEVVQFLVENGANWKAASGEIDGVNTALHLASAFGHFEVSRYLSIAKPELVNVLNKRGHTAAQLATLLWNKNYHSAAARRNSSW